MSKRYAIVRVDDKCPVNLEEDISTVDRIKMFDCIGKRQCGDCRYGDTKEQLIRKVAQALELCMKKGYRTITSEEYAKFIVEFLGVE